MVSLFLNGQSFGILNDRVDNVKCSTEEEDDDSDTQRPEHCSTMEPCFNEGKPNNNMCGVLSESCATWEINETGKAEKVQKDGCILSEYCGRDDLKYKE